MKDTQFDRERKYLGTMCIAKRLLREGVITEEEYCKIDTKFKGIYGPSLSTLFTDITLIDLQKYRNM